MRLLHTRSEDQRNEPRRNKKSHTQISTKRLRTERTGREMIAHSLTHTLRVCQTDRLRFGMFRDQSTVSIRTNVFTQNRQTHTHIESMRVSELAISAKKKPRKIQEYINVRLRMYLSQSSIENRLHIYWRPTYGAHCSVAAQLSVAFYISLFSAFFNAQTQQYLYFIKYKILL